MKTFIYRFFHYFKRLHERALELGENNPYNELLYWLLDIIQYGIIIAFVIATITGFPTFGRFVLIAIAAGMSKWLWTEFIKITTESTRKRKE